MSDIINIDAWCDDPLANYGGSDRKTGLISPDGKRYMVKYSEKHAKKNDIGTSYVNNVISENISSNILRIIGYPVHNTFIASKNDTLCVACENFATDGTLIEFGTFMQKHYDSGDIGRVPALSQIYDILSTDTMLREHKDEFIDSYFERFVGDALVGNFDRHKGNFGYIVTADGNIRVSPIYDNGSTLFPSLSENAMETEILSDPKEIAKRALLFPKAALSVNKTKVRYLDMLSSGYDENASRAVCKMVPMIKQKMPEIEAYINNQNYLSDTRKVFYNAMLNARMELILQPAYDVCINGKYIAGYKAYLENGYEYKEPDFEKDWKTLCTTADMHDKISSIVNKCRNNIL